MGKDLCVERGCNDFVAHGKTDMCVYHQRNANNLRKAVIKELKREEQQKEKDRLESIAKYMEENNNYFKKVSDGILVENVSCKFGLNKENLKHMDMIRKAQTVAGVFAGYNIKIGQQEDN